MKGAWILRNLDTGRDCICSSLPVVFLIAPVLEQHQRRIYRDGGITSDGYDLKRCRMYRKTDMR